MSGKPKQKAYHYDNDGKFIKEYSCMEEIRKEYYSSDKGKRPLFVTNAKIPNGTYKVITKDYLKLPDNTFATKERIGREGIRKINKRINNPFINNENKYFDILNLDNEVIASFNNIKVAAVLLNKSVSNIHSRLKKQGIIDSSDGLTFKYRIC